MMRFLVYASFCLLASCSFNGYLHVFNATGVDLVLLLDSELYSDNRYNVPAGEVTVISMNHDIENPITLNLKGSTYCLRINRVPLTWISRGHVYASVRDADSPRFLLYEDKDLAGEPPQQPDGFPLRSTQGQCPSS